MKFLEGYKTILSSAAAAIVIGLMGIGVIPIETGGYILSFIGVTIPIWLRMAITTEAAKAADAVAKRP